MKINMEKGTNEMSRMETYFELAKYVHQDHYKQIITWKTEHLKRLLDWHTRERKEDFKNIDWAKFPEENYRRFYKTPTSYHDILQFLRDKGIKIALPYGIETIEEKGKYIYPYKFFENGGKVQLTFRKKEDGRYEQVLKTL